MDEQRQDDQLEPIYNSSGPIQHIALKNYREEYTIEKGWGERMSGRSVLVARHEYDKKRQTNLFDLLVEPWQVLPFWVVVYLEVIAMKEYYTLSKDLLLESY